MPQAILAIDQGTTGSTALLIDKNLNVLGKETVDFPQHFPQPGWVEHNPGEIWHSVCESIRLVLKKTEFSAADITAIGITNQRETTILWDRSTGHSPCNAIVWQDRRSADICNELKERDLEVIFRQKTGLTLDPYFSGSKLTWLFRNNQDVKKSAEDGSLAFGTVDSYLVWQLTEGAVHITDVSNASRTLLMDIHTCEWDSELARHLEVPESILPEIVPSSQIYGETKGLGFLPDGIPIAGIAGDQQAALFGQACFDAGESKCTYGTGAFLLENIGKKPVPPPEGLLTTVAWRIGNDTYYAIEGSSFIAGAAVQWLRDGLGVINSSQEIEGLALQVADADGLHFVPALTGLGAPYWRSEARGVIWGITRGTTKAHLARATLDGIALQVADLISTMNKAGNPITELRVDGGACKNDLLMQIQADVTGLNIVRPEIVETTALGAAMLAGLAVGLWPNLNSLKATWKLNVTFEPNIGEEERAVIISEWQKVVEKA